MAQLIQMRQRIKAIETIKKITHAMRLISMSMHSRIKNKSPYLKTYNNEVENIFKKLLSMAPNWQSKITNPNLPQNSNALFILVGSQKGLCGTFNVTLFKEFEHLIKKEDLENTSFIAVGKKAIDYLNGKKTKSVIYEFNEINMRNFTQISNKIVEIIVNGGTENSENTTIKIGKTINSPYSSVKILGNELKTFFYQKPKLTPLVPLQENPEMLNNKKYTFNKNEYVLEQKIEEILDNLAPQYISSNINSILLESLLSEQAARFVSMDSATRNAKKLLEETTIAYNKLRQAKITKELTELASNF